MATPSGDSRFLVPRDQQAPWITVVSEVRWHNPQKIVLDGAHINHLLGVCAIYSETTVGWRVQVPSEDVLGSLGELNPFEGQTTFQRLRRLARMRPSSAEPLFFFTFLDGRALTSQWIGCYPLWLVKLRHAGGRNSGC